MLLARGMAEEEITNVNSRFSTLFSFLQIGDMHMERAFGIRKKDVDEVTKQLTEAHNYLSPNLIVFSGDNVSYIPGKGLIGVSAFDTVIARLCDHMLSTSSVQDGSSCDDVIRVMEGNHERYLKAELPCDSGVGDLDTDEAVVQDHFYVEWPRESTNSWSVGENRDNETTKCLSMSFLNTQVGAVGGYPYDATYGCVFQGDVERLLSHLHHYQLCYNIVLSHIPLYAVTNVRSCEDDCRMLYRPSLTHTLIENITSLSEHSLAGHLHISLTDTVHQNTIDSKHSCHTRHTAGSFGYRGSMSYHVFSVDNQTNNETLDTFVMLSSSMQKLKDKPVIVFAEPNCTSNYVAMVVFDAKRHKLHKITLEQHGIEYTLKKHIREAKKSMKQGGGGGAPLFLSTKDIGSFNIGESFSLAVHFSDLNNKRMRTTTAQRFHQAELSCLSSLLPNTLINFNHILGDIVGVATEVLSREALVILVTHSPLIFLLAFILFALTAICCVIRVGRGRLWLKLLWICVLTAAPYTIQKLDDGFYIGFSLGYVSHGLVYYDPRVLTRVFKHLMSVFCLASMKHVVGNIPESQLPFRSALNIVVRILFTFYSLKLIWLVVKGLLDINRSLELFPIYILAILKQL